MTTGTQRGGGRDVSWYPRSRPGKSLVGTLGPLITRCPEDQDQAEPRLQG
jgi:hypothetical protein